MASNTPNLDLLKKDPVTDGNDTFNIETMLNENWDKIDAAVGQLEEEMQEIDIPLSDETNGTRSDVAASEKAVGDAALQAKTYTDQQINLVTETGIPKLVSYPLLVTASADNQTEFDIPLDTFDDTSDTLLVSINRATLDATKYTVTNTVRDGAGQVTQRAKLNLLSGVEAGSRIALVVLKNVPLGPDGVINGAVLAVDSVPVNRVNGLQELLDEAFQAGNERKVEVVAALVALGAPASASDSWDELVSKMTAIIKATGNATTADVIAGKTFSNGNGNGLQGTMPNRSEENLHQPAGAVEFWEGDRVFFQPPQGYYNGSSWVYTSVPNLKSENIRKGVDIFWLTGTLEPGFTGSADVDVILDRFSNPGQVKQAHVITFPQGTKWFRFQAIYSVTNNPCYFINSSDNRLSSGLYYMDSGGSLRAIVDRWFVRDRYPDALEWSALVEGIVYAKDLFGIQARDYYSKNISSVVTRANMKMPLTLYLYSSLDSIAGPNNYVEPARITGTFHYGG